MDDILQRIGETEGPAGLFVIAAFSALEYLFPPFPGDLAVVAGAFLVAARGWSPLPVLGASTGGSLAGAFVHFALGRWLSHRNWSPKGPRGKALLASVQRVAAGFERHGTAYLAVNRLLPGLRAFFFFAAGWTGMPTKTALLWGTVSAVAWNLLLIGAAFLVGQNVDSLQSIVKGWTIAVWIVLAGALVVFWLRRRRKA